MKKRIKVIVMIIALLLSAIIIVGSIYYVKTYPKQDFDLVLYTLSNGVEHTSTNVINSILLSCIIPLIILFILLILPTIKKAKNNIYMNIKLGKRTFSIQLYPIKITSNHRIIYTIAIIIIALFTFVKCFNITDYIKNKFQDTRIFEKYYVDARDVNITFPDNKRNLIIIIGESFENTVLSKENGGAWDYSLMPELEKIALENTSFSNNDKLGGAFQTHGTDYSAGGNIAITAGIPLKTVDILSDKNIYTGNGKYLSGAYSIR